MAELGILKGRTPDTFVPNAPITRAEFAAICARFDTGENAGGATFPDLVATGPRRKWNGRVPGLDYGL